MKHVIKFLAIRQVICSHGRSYEYFTESLLSAIAHNCTFWAHRWNLTYRHLLQTIMHPCDNETCTEMGIRAELYDERGTFYVATDSSSPFCSKYYSYCTINIIVLIFMLLLYRIFMFTVNDTAIIEEVRMQLQKDFDGETKD